MHEVWAGESLLTFDGTVLEVFGFPGSASTRFHVRNMELSVGEPDRKGRRALEIKPAARGSGGLRFEVEAEDWADVGPFADRVLAAMPD